MKNTKLEEQLLVKLLLNQVIFKKLYLVKMCPIFDSSPPVFGARYQSFLRVCWFLHKGVPYFGYLSEQLKSSIDISVYIYSLSNMNIWEHLQLSWIFFSPKLIKIFLKSFILEVFLQSNFQEILLYLIIPIMLM